MTRFIAFCQTPTKVERMTKFGEPRFTVPPARVTQAEWDRIFGPKRRNRPPEAPGAPETDDRPGAT